MRGKFSGNGINYHVLFFYAQRELIHINAYLFYPTYFFGVVFLGFAAAFSVVAFGADLAIKGFPPTEALMYSPQVKLSCPSFCALALSMA
ncbi:hypothetical protein D3C72_2213730 [compost metagenome]